MPVTDARLSVGFPHHPKTQKLYRRLGAAGPWHFTVLILWCAQNKPDGDLQGMDDEDIEIAAAYPGEAGELIQTLMDVGFMKGAPTLRRINDWKAHQPWAYHAEDRSEKAREAARARWQKEKAGKNR